MKDTKIQCRCGCRRTFYIASFDDDNALVAMGVEENARYSFKHFNGVIIDKKELLKHRDTEKDIGRDISEKSRRVNEQDIFSANIQRVQEALRVLE